MHLGFSFPVLQRLKPIRQYARAVVTCFQDFECIATKQILVEGNLSNHLKSGLGLFKGEILEDLVSGRFNLIWYAGPKDASDLRQSVSGPLPLRITSVSFALDKVDLT